MRIQQNPGASPLDSALGRVTLKPQWVDRLKEIKNLHVFIATPSRNEQCYIGYATSLAKTVSALISAGIEVTMENTRNSCFVHVARNNLLAKFIKNSTATHILMIDDDMSWSPYWAPLEMLSYNKEFIAGAGPVKGEKRFAVDLIQNEGSLCSVREVGGAFILLSREMVLKMMEEYKNLNHQVFDGFPRLFEDRYTRDQWIGEDYVFCDRWRQIGGEIYVYPDIYFEHLGLYAVEGKYRDKLDEMFQKKRGETT